MVNLWTTAGVGSERGCRHRMDCATIRHIIRWWRFKESQLSGIQMGDGNTQKDEKLKYVQQFWELEGDARDVLRSGTKEGNHAKIFADGLHTAE